MHDLDLILTLAGGLSAALVPGYITQRFGLSPIVATCSRARWWALTHGDSSPTAGSPSSSPRWGSFCSCSASADLHTPTGHIAVGWLVVEDLFTVVALARAFGETPTAGTAIA